MDIKENTVSAKNQMRNLSELSFLGNETAPIKILILGNSITRHAPAPEVGWFGDWGMSASAPENDYVHRLYAKLTENGFDVFMRIRQASFWERNFLKEDILSYYNEERDFQADVVIFRLGENVISEDAPYFKEALKKLMSHVSERGKAVYTTSFWKSSTVDEAILSVAKERGEICLDGGLSKDETNMAIGQFEHRGVSVHPNDKGMEAYANLLFESLKVMIAKL